LTSVKSAGLKPPLPPFDSRLFGSVFASKTTRQAHGRLHIWLPLHRPSTIAMCSIALVRPLPGTSLTSCPYRHDSINEKDRRISPTAKTSLLTIPLPEHPSPNDILRCESSRCFYASALEILDFYHQTLPFFPTRRCSFFSPAPALPSAPGAMLTPF